MIIVKIRRNSTILKNHQQMFSLMRESSSNTSIVDDSEVSQSVPIKNPKRVGSMANMSPSNRRNTPSVGSLGNNLSFSNECIDEDNQEAIDEGRPLLNPKKFFTSNSSLNLLAKKGSSNSLVIPKSGPKPNTVTQPLEASLPSTFSFFMFGSNIKYSTLTQRDIDEYIQFLHSQSRTALYYIAVLTFNWIVWIVSRLCWEFTQCQQSESQSIIIFVLLSIAEQCSGPRMSSILLSIIFGISEDTVSPSTLFDMFQDVTCLRYFTTYCSERDSTVSNKEPQEEKPLPIEYDNLVFFWFDIYQLKELIMKEEETEQELRKKKISAKVQDICDLYFSETSQFKINSDIVTNKEKNFLRTTCINYIKGGAHDESDDEYSESSDVEGDSASTVSGAHEGVPKEDLVLLNTLKQPLKSSLKIMNDLLSEFKTSPAFDELINILRMKAVSQRRSLFKDIISKLGRLFINCFGMCQVFFLSSRHESEVEGYETVTDIENKHVDHVDVQIKDLWSKEYSQDVFEFLERLKNLKLDNRKIWVI